MNTVVCLWASLLQSLEKKKKRNFMGGCQHSKFYSYIIPWMTTRHQMFGCAISQVDLHKHNISWLARWFILTILLKTMCCQHIHFPMGTQHEHADKYRLLQPQQKRQCLSCISPCVRFGRTGIAVSVSCLPLLVPNFSAELNTQEAFECSSVSLETKACGPHEKCIQLRND